MTNERPWEADPRIQAALAQLQERLQAQYPQATFSIVHGDDPEGVYLVVTVDIEDTDAVLDVVIEDLFHLQVEELLPVYVIPALPLTRVAEQLRARVNRREASLPPLLPV